MKKSLLAALIMVPAVIVGINISGPKQESQVEAAYAPYQIVNGGFETGDFTGWSKYYIWKNEDGMKAFDDSLIHGNTYFGSNPYNKDGSYQLGITSLADSGSGTIKWDQSAERMGYLRSSNFTLGGSGWISFRMGGARFASFAYISVRKSADDTEVARFGNRWYNDTDRATTVYGSSISNAEAFMFPYYFNLSTVVALGTGLYIMLCDTSALSWSVISADNFVTYYATAPSHEDDDMAYNIIPSISGAGSGTNTIPNGGFDSNLNNWSIGLKADGTSEGNWVQDSGHALSNGNGTGDGGIGCLRSSAFILTDNKYVKVDWAGGIAYDKRIFMSIKEVGTNIEKLRFVRRDNLSGEKSSNYNNHLLDTSGLSASKEYYIEFADNSDEGWGVNFVNTVELTATYSPSGDYAVLITPFDSTFAAPTLTTQQEATGYGADFINETGSYCTALDGGAMATDGKWTTLSSNYASLSDAAKNYFVDAGTTDPNVVAARDRYVFLIGKYSALHDNNFMKNSAGVVYHATSNNNLPLVDAEKMTSALIFIVSATALACVSYIVFRKKKEQRS